MEIDSVHTSNKAENLFPCATLLGIGRFMLADARFKSVGFVLCGVIILLHAIFRVNASNPIQSFEGLVYSEPDDLPLKLNLFLPENNDKGLRGAVLCIHGGGFRGGRREAMDSVCEELAARGYAASTLSYRLAPEHQFPRAVHDVKAALRWLSANSARYRIDTNRIGVLGVSAGGHLALMAGVTMGVGSMQGKANAKVSSPPVKCVVSVFGASDLQRLQGKSSAAVESVALWLGGAFEEHPHRYATASPLNWVSSDAPPTLLVHGAEDPVVPYEQSKWMHAALQKAGVESSLFTMEGIGHSLEGESGENARQAIFEFLDLHLKEGRAMALIAENNLDQWESVGSAEWRVENGVLFGGQNGDPSRSGVLSTKRTFKNFDIELNFAIDEHGKYNSGVYLRNTPGTARRRGYQINIGRAAAGEYVGLYSDHWLDKGDEMDAYRKKLDWNHLRIRAVGPHIQSWLNGRKIVDYTDPDPEPHLLEPGVISLQTYGAEGHAGWVKFRNMRLLELP